jgi:anti-sigma factor RsiW
VDHLTWDEVWAYIEGESTVDAHDVREHLRTCAECSRKVTSARRLDSSLQRILSAGMSGVSEDRTEQLFRTLRTLQSNPQEPSTRRQRRPWVWISSAAGAAAAVVIGAVLGMHSFQRQSAPNDAASTVNPAVAVAGSENQTEAHATDSKSAGSQVLLQDGKQFDGVSEDVVDHTSVEGVAQVVVRDSAGHPLPGAHVAFVQNGKVGPVLTTDDSGKTPAQRLRIPVDPMLQPFLGKNLSPSGVVTVVAWKDGYRPVVCYEIGVFQDGSPYQPTLTLEDGANRSVDVTGSGVNGTYPPAVLEGIANGVKQVITSKRLEGSLTQLPHGTSRLDVRVTDETGQPVPGATVAVFAKGRITGYGVTSADGRLTVFPTGGTDWRRAASEPALDASQAVGCIVVFKDDYAPAIGLYQPLVPGRARDVEVHLESYRYRQQQGMKNTEAPTRIAGNAVPTQDDGQRIYKQVLAASAGS